MQFFLQDFELLPLYFMKLLKKTVEDAYYFQKRQTIVHYAIILVR